jgi:hypothetical protein
VGETKNIQLTNSFAFFRENESNFQTIYFSKLYFHNIYYKLNILNSS